LTVSAPLPITFLSDYGYEDEFVGVCHGVIQGIAPGALVIDIAHGLPRHEVRPAAIVLRNALPYMPAGVHMAVVDPGVGTPRRPAALRTANGRLLVGPDNGVLMLAAEKLGGVELAVDLSSSPFRLEPASATFHGRDVFAPAAALLASGRTLEELGEPFAASELERIALPATTISGGELKASAIYIDRFGNVQLNATRADATAADLSLGHRLTVEAGGGRRELLFARTFADAPAGAALVYEDSSGALALAVNRGDAARELGIELDSHVTLRR
jgi:S-adenosylmethionine hydrolase